MDIRKEVFHMLEAAIAGFVLAPIVVASLIAFYWAKEKWERL